MLRPNMEIQRKYPLHSATQMGNYDDVVSLINKGHDINKTDLHECTPLHVAAEFGHKAIVELLLAKGAKTEVFCEYARDFNLVKNEKFCPVHFAAKYGHLDILILLLGEGGHYSSKYSTPLHSAAEGGKIQIIKYLLENGQSVDVQDKLKCTPLHVAAGSGRKEAVELLLQRRAKIHAQNEYAYTPLHFASRFGHVTIVKLLLAKGADIHITLQNGSTAMHLAAQNNFKEVVQILLQGEPSLWPPNSKVNGYSSFHRAIQEGRRKVVKFFLNNQVHVDLQTSNGLTPLHIAAQCDQTFVARMLIDRGADINYRTPSTGMTAFLYATKFLWPRSMIFLIQAGANFDAQDHSKNSATDILMEISRKRPRYKKPRQMKCAKVIIKYNLLKNPLYKPQFPFDYLKLEEYASDCLQEIIDMQEIVISNTAVSLYTFLKDTCDDIKLVRYLYNKNLRQELQNNVSAYFQDFVIYRDMSVLVKSRIKRGLDRQRRLEEINKLKDNVLQLLPAEVRILIYSYLNINDLKKFISAFKKKPISR